MAVVVFCKQKTAYEMRISDWSSDVCSSDLFDILDTGGPAMAALLAASVATAAKATARISFFCITGFLPLKERTEADRLSQCPCQGACRVLREPANAGSDRKSVV